MVVSSGVQVTADVAVDGVVRVKVTGELAAPVDTASAARLMAVLDQQLPASVLELNLSGLWFCDVAGLRILIGLRERVAAAGGQTRVVAAARAVSLLLELTGTASLFGYPPRPESASDDVTAG